MGASGVRSAGVFRKRTRQRPEVVLLPPVLGDKPHECDVVTALGCEEPTIVQAWTVSLQGNTLTTSSITGGRRARGVA